MDRRTFIAVAAAWLAAPLAVEGQQAEKIYRIGFLSSSLSPTGLEGLRQGLRDLGYIEGRRIAIEARFAELDLNRLPDRATELVKLRPDVIVRASTPALRHFKSPSWGSELCQIESSRRRGS